MIVKTPYGVSPSIEMSIAGVAVDYNALESVELNLAENQHDMMVFEIMGIPPRAITAYYGAPVEFKMHTGVNFVQEFVGYVEDVRPISKTAGGMVNKSPFQRARLVCMGASYIMRGSASKTWDYRKVSDVAKEIAAKYRFSVDVPSDDFVIDRLVQANESDWQFLTKYAGMLGYAVTAHGTHIHVYDPKSVLSRQTSFHNVRTIVGSNVTSNAEPGHIMEFTGTFSSRATDGRYKENEIAVIDPNNSVYNFRTNTLSPSLGPARFKNRVGDYADGLGEARRRLRAIDKEKYDYRATATVIGLAGCVPGGVVNVDQYSAEFDGYWCVKEVRHRAHSNAFITELELAKNRTIPLEQDNTAPFQKPPKSLYDRNVWVASKARVREYQ